MPLPQSQYGATVTYLASAARAATTNSSGNEVGIEMYSQVIVELAVTVASGTTPTLNVYLQQLLPDGTTWNDIGAFTQMTGTGTRVMAMVAGGNSEFAQGSGALTAGTMRATPLGDTHRVRAVIGGTNPSFTFSVVARYYP